MVVRGRDSRLVTLILLGGTLAALGFLLWVTFDVIEQSQLTVEELLGIEVWLVVRG